MTLTDFLSARIAEDEGWANLSHDHDRWYPTEDNSGPTVAEKDRTDQSWRVAVVANDNVAQHIARHDPARVLAECAARRAIVELHKLEEPQQYRPWQSSSSIERGEPAPSLVWSGGYCNTCDGYEQFRTDGQLHPCETLRLLAQPFADHPDFDPAWRLP